MKRGLIIVLFVVLFSVIAAASDLDIQVKQLTENVQPGETAVYELTITNNVQQDQFVLSKDPLSTNEVITSMMLDPSLSPIDLSQSPTKLKLNLGLSDTIDPNKNYGVNLILTSIDGSVKQTIPLTIRVNPYSQLVGVNILTTEIYPGKDISFKLTVKNRGADYLENINIKLESIVLNQQKTVNLPPRKEQDIEIPIQIPSTTEFGDYNLTVLILNGQQIIGKQSQIIKVTKQPDLQKSEQVTQGLLSKKLTIIHQNQGNIVLESEYQLVLSKFNNMFASFNTEPTSQTLENNNYVYKWIFTLQPGIKHTLVIQTDYKPLAFIIFLVVIFALIIRAWLRTGVLIHKTVLKANGGYKIIIDIKNNTGKECHNVQIVDIVPTILAPVKDSWLIKPDAVQHTNLGTNVIWNIPQLTKGEERIYSYKIERKMNIIGRTVLPVAFVRYHCKGKAYKLNSNIAQLQI